MDKPFLYHSQDTSDNSTFIHDETIFDVERRGIKSGCICIGESGLNISLDDKRLRWQKNEPVHLSGFLADKLSDYRTEIESSADLYQALLKGTEIDVLLDSTEYLSRLGEKFELLSTRVDESDRQELISVDFDAMKNGELDMEDIWMRISWLSFLEEETSLRFRFSFGMEGFDDVSLDLNRQLAAAELCDRLFPESGIVCLNDALCKLLTEVASVQQFHFLERIVYYNADNGGAQFHHDAEKGHLGVVYAQLTGRTLWLALSKRQLMEEIQLFLSDKANLAELQIVVKTKGAYERLLLCLNDKCLLESLLDDPANEEISELLNESVRFFEQLVTKGYGFVLKPGDIMLLPQENMKNCAWHSVFCLGKKAGQALSFAMKAAD